MKKTVYIIILYLTTFVSCSSSNNNISVNPLSEKETNMAVEKDLTFEEIKNLSLSANLGLDDLIHYNNIHVADYNPSGQYYYYEITYEDLCFRLDISYKDDSLKNVFFAQKDKEVAVDIRNGIIEHVLHDNVSMRDYMEYTLPEGLSDGKFDAFLGSGGGTPFVYEEGSDVFLGAAEIHWGISGVFSDGNLVGMESFANHSSYGKFDMVSHSVPCVITTFDYDIYDEEKGEYIGTSELWYAFWSIEGSIPVFALCLNPDYFSFSEFLTLVDSVSFSERAFINQYGE